MEKYLSHKFKLDVIKQVGESQFIKGEQKAFLLSVPSRSISSPSQISAVD